MPPWRRYSRSRGVSRRTRAVKVVSSARTVTSFASPFSIPSIANSSRSFSKIFWTPQQEGIPLLVIAGKEYGSGSSRDWAAKGPMLLGVKAVIVGSFERIHRSNLIGMGVLPLTFPEGMSRKTLGLDGSETFHISGLSHGLKPRMQVPCKIERSDGRVETITLDCRVDTLDEVEYFRHGGILQYVLRNMMKAA